MISYNISMNIALFLEIKNEYTEHLVDTITPFIFEGLSSIYKEAAQLTEQTNQPTKTLMTFQKLLQSVETWNQTRVEEETNRIKMRSGTSEYLNDLVKAVIKSNIILLAYSNTISNLIGQTFYNTLTTPTFVHRCYIECAKDAHNNPYLFYHDIEPMDFKRNQIIVQEYIQKAIIRAVRKILPISLILKEYLINSVNIINEPPKVELVGLPQPDIPAIPIPEKHLSEKQLHPNLEKKVMDIIKSEHIKTDKQKIQAMMNIEKIITSMEPKNINDLSTKSSTKKSEMKHVSSASKKFMQCAPYHEDQEDANTHPANANLNLSDKELINIDLEESIRSESINKKALSGTTMSIKPQPKNIQVQKISIETSERVDPKKVNLIEDYGSQMGGTNKSASKKNAHK